MKKYFLTGFIILLPVAITLAVVFFLFNLLTQPFVGLFKGIFEPFISSDELQIFISQLVILFLLFFVTVSLGLLARWFFLHHLIRLGEKFIKRIPFISGIYSACKDVIKTLFTSDANAFKQVVIVRFPHADAQTIGLITNESPESQDCFGKAVGKDMTLVFIPTTPNPTSGFLVVCRKSDLIYLDMKVEEAFKFIISCGVIAAPFKEKGAGVFSPPGSPPSTNISPDSLAASSEF